MSVAAAFLALMTGRTLAMLHCIARRWLENIDENAHFRPERGAPRMYFQARSQPLASFA